MEEKPGQAEPGKGDVDDLIFHGEEQGRPSER